MRYIDREGNLTQSTTGQDKLLLWLYTHRIGRLLLKPLIHPLVSKAGGALLSTKVSAMAVKPFVKHCGIDLSVCEKQHFDSYNDFFCRRLKDGQRPVEMSQDILVSPCDGKVSVYPIGEDSVLSIKHTPYTLHSLLRQEKLAKQYAGGYAFVIRLTVDDYHRYCYADSGIKSADYTVPGVFHTVNPAANDVYPIYKENTRKYCLIKTENFGTLLQMEVGALMVGKIVNLHESKGLVRRGAEKGYFQFGGSTVVLLLQKDKVCPDADILANTKAQCETIVKMGSQIGTG